MITSTFRYLTLVGITLLLWTGIVNFLESEFSGVTNSWLRITAYSICFALFLAVLSYFAWLLLIKPSQLAIDSVLPIFDASDALTKARDNPIVAEEMLDILAKTLPQDMNQLKKHYHEKDLEGIKDLLHRMAGGLQFTSVPSLQTSIEKTQGLMLSDQFDEALLLIPYLLFEAERFLQWKRDTAHPF